MFAMEKVHDQTMSTLSHLEESLKDNNLCSSVPLNKLILLGQVLSYVKQVNWFLSHSFSQKFDIPNLPPFEPDNQMSRATMTSDVRTKLLKVTRPFFSNLCEEHSKDRGSSEKQID
jgi:hypothetical protein